MICRSWIPSEMTTFRSRRRASEPTAAVSRLWRPLRAEVFDGSDDDTDSGDRAKDS